MNRFGVLALGAILGVSLCHAQDAASSSPATTGRGAFPVKLTKTLDSSKLKEGDAVEVETAGSFKLADGTLVPKGSKLEGHVTASKARSKGDPDSELTVSFDKLDIANGKQISIKGAVQAVFPPAEEVAPMMAGKANGAAGGGYGAGPGTGGTATVGTLTNSTIGSNTGSAKVVDPAASPQSVGVQGMRDLDLEDGALRSKGKSVKLGNGVRMIVHADILE
jgi:hypothetical protein